MREMMIRGDHETKVRSGRSYTPTVPFGASGAVSGVVETSTLPGRGICRDGFVLRDGAEYFSAIVALLIPLRNARIDVSSNTVPKHL